MDYEEFNREYKKFEEWNNDEEGSEVADELLWGKKNDVPQLKLEGPHANNDRWLKFGQCWEDSEMMMGKNGGGYKKVTRIGYIPDDRVNSPSHYTSGRMEAIDIIEDAISVAPTPQKGFLQAQVLKYILRLWLKDNPVEDARKASWYLNRLINQME